jgi:sortase A
MGTADRRPLAVLMLGVGLALATCAGDLPRRAPAEPAERPRPTVQPPSASQRPPADHAPTSTPPGPTASDGRPARALLTIPTLGIEDLPVVPYLGRTDDAPGTGIQNRGLAASPHGPHGGVGPGGVGNYQVTAHRLSSTQAFRHLPGLAHDSLVVVESRGARYVYRIVTTRKTSFRSPHSLREQRAAVPGKPGVRPTRAMITLSTCATIEDHAAGNYWADEFDNPEHRFDKIGVLVRSSVPGDQAD